MNLPGLTTSQLRQHINSTYRKKKDSWPYCDASKAAIAKRRVQQAEEKQVRDSTDLSKKQLWNKKTNGRLEFARREAIAGGCAICRGTESSKFMMMNACGHRLHQCCLNINTRVCAVCQVPLCDDDK